MRILWIVNMLLPEAADYLNVTTSASGSWMIDISQKLADTKNIDLAVACVHGNQFRKIKVNHITYYLLPGTGKNMLFYTSKYEKLWQKINDDFRPDIVHLHGTEYSHGLSFLRSCPQVKAIVSLQGLLTRIKDVDLGGIPAHEFLRNRTWSEMLHLNGVLELHLLNKKNSEYENEILKRVHYVNGVNTWDISLAQCINPKLKTFKLEYNLRDEIYAASKWSINGMQRHLIFSNPGGVPLKGIHQLIKAVALLKPKYKDIVLKVPGMGRNGKLEIHGSYEKYLYKLIKKLNVEENVVFLGRQTAFQMCENMQKAHIVVVPSAIESVSMVLREAMYIGCPSIASFRGGMADFIADKEDGFLYDYQEYSYLAARIAELFENDDLCIKFSNDAMIKAQKAHDRERNVSKYIDMYNVVMYD